MSGPSLNTCLRNNLKYKSMDQIMWAILIHLSQQIFKHLSKKQPQVQK